MRKPFAIAAALAATLLSAGMGTAHAETVPGGYVSGWTDLRC
ncbi:hypothetical protein SK854_46910 [Lentzea sp. BCCO 10_0061]|uniref:Chitinase n=1 Tax=Lentzea sokolovensis TaxID=3095429 RepID=A0ABU4VD75_9PSEU|nr:hypothetical protein [Lentzea sp. BCCO 10_0061]MDX8149724.1 hypothetical protein [Lentzea sp. BCCO 10_0061]